MSGKFNPGILTIARQFRRMSQEELASATGVSQGFLSKLEHGLHEPAAAILDRLAKALRFPQSLFLQPDYIYGLPASVHPMHRKRASVPRKELDYLNAIANFKLIHLRRWLQAANYEGAMPLPSFDVDEFNGNIERIAEITRRTWLLPAGPVSNLTEHLERAGVIVVWCDFEEAAVDGFSYCVPGTPPCIFLNFRRPADRMRFTLAHELGHLVMHRVPSPTMEKEADTFAAAFLMPAADISNFFVRRITLPFLASLKPIWKVAIQALLKRAGDLGFITPYQERRLWQQVSASGIRKSEPSELNFPAEQPKVIREVLRLHFEDLGYSQAQMLEISHIDESDDFDALHFTEVRPRSGQLRVVR